MIGVSHLWHCFSGLPTISHMTHFPPLLSLKSGCVSQSPEAFFSFLGINIATIPLTHSCNVSDSLTQSVYILLSRLTDRLTLSPVTAVHTLTLLCECSCPRMPDPPALTHASGRAAAVQSEQPPSRAVSVHLGLFQFADTDHSGIPNSYH